MRAVLSIVPDTYEVLEAFCLYRGYVEFDYKPLPECQAKVNKNAPSRIAAAQSTTMIAPPERVKGYIEEDSPKMTKEGNFILNIRNINRRNQEIQIDAETGEIIGFSYYADKSNKQRDGSRKIGYDDGEYMPRSFRLDVRGDFKGIQLETVRVVGKREDGTMGKVRLFPNADIDENHLW
jgi:hypothetical protein